MIFPINRSVDGSDTRSYEVLLKWLQPEGLLRLRRPQCLLLVLLKPRVRIAVPGLAAPASLEERTASIS